MTRSIIKLMSCIDENYSFKKAHFISEAVHDAVERDSGAIHGMVHANPRKDVIN